MSENTSLRELLSEIIDIVHRPPMGVGPTCPDDFELDGRALFAMKSRIEAAIAALSTPPAEGDDTADAKRYRFLRDRSELRDDFDFFIREVSAYTFRPHPHENIRHETFDAAVDAAMIAATEGSNPS